MAIEGVLWLSHIRHHGVLLWNDVTVDWSIVDMWFGRCSTPAAGMRARGLVYSLPVAQTTMFVARNEN